ncbi:MAG: hypothetical protein IRZ32_12810 [Solirubrobacteraceae bacterium]|nr:hypothetical protein [Solirubrobacteraceae bacterium]
MRRLLVALCAAALLAPACASARTVPEGFFGVMADGVLMTRDDASFAHEFRLMKASGVETIRPVVYWADMQPERGGPLITLSLDRLMGEAARNGLRVVPVVLRAPAWARVDPSNFASPPRDPQDFAAYLQALIARYGPNGTFWAENPDVPKRPQRVWQVWNEPNLNRYWSSPKPFARDFVALQRAAYRAIKAADPGATVVLAGFGNDSWNALEKAYDAGLNGSMYDVAGMHPFSGRVANVMKIVRLNRQVMNRHGDARKPIMITEITWPSALGTEATTTTGFETTEAGQARKLTEAYRGFMRRRKAWRIQNVIWSTWLTSDMGSTNSFDWSGLRRLNPADPAGEPLDKPALAAYRSLALAAQR